MATNPQYAAAPKGARRSRKAGPRGTVAARPITGLAQFAPRAQQAGSFEITELAKSIDRGGASAALLSCLEIIAPKADQRQSCCLQIAYCFEQCRTQLVPLGGVGGAKARQEMFESARVLRSAAKLMQNKPFLNSLTGKAFADDEWARTSERLALAASRLEPIRGGLNAFKQTDEWKRLSERFQSFVRERYTDNEIVRMIESLEYDQSVKKKQTKPPDLLKRNYAMVAHWLLHRFSAHRPTLSIDGPFYRLASALYEAVTRKTGISLERQCKTAFHRRERCPLPVRVGRHCCSDESLSLLVRIGSDARFSPRYAEIVHERSNDLRGRRQCQSTSGDRIRYR